MCIDSIFLSLEVGQVIQSHEVIGVIHESVNHRLDNITTIGRSLFHSAPVSVKVVSPNS